MKIKKAVLLFLALLFPACIFVFLKYFGRNEFTVPALYTEDYPEGLAACGITVSLPYHVPDSVQRSLHLAKDSLMLIHFGERAAASQEELAGVKNKYGNEIQMNFIQTSESNVYLRRCIFFLDDDNDLVLLDGEGVIRGHYHAGDREEIDRLLIEIAILLKKY